MIRKICCLVSLLALPLSGLAQLDVADIDPCNGCIQIAVSRDVITTGDTIQATVNIKTDGVNEEVVDVYMVLLLPSGQVDFVLEVDGFHIQEIVDLPVSVQVRSGSPVGSALLAAILVEPDTDRSLIRQWAANKGVGSDWLAVDAKEVVLVDTPWTPSADSFYLSNDRYPQIIAHAGGSIHRHNYTSSLEAMNKSYVEGHRYFEIDFSWTSDGQMVAIHDWEHTYERLFKGESGVAPTADEFMEGTMAYGLSQMDLDDVLHWLDLHPDAHLVPDIKTQPIQGLSLIKDKAPHLMPRIIAQVPSPEGYHKTKSLGYDSVVYMDYMSSLSDREMLDFARTPTVDAVFVPWRKVAFSDIGMKLQDAGVPVYAHSVDSLGLAEFLMTRGAIGFHTNTLTPGLMRDGGTAKTPPKSIDLKQEMDGTSLLTGIADLAPFTTDFRVRQDEDSGMLWIRGQAFSGAAIPVDAERSKEGAVPGVFVDEKGDLAFVLGTGYTVTAYPALANARSLITSLQADYNLDLSTNGRNELLIHGVNQAVEDADIVFAARPAVTSMPVTSGKGVGVHFDPGAGLAGMGKFFYVYPGKGGQLMEQGLVPLPADWRALQDTLRTLEGAGNIKINGRGVISMTVNGQHVRGVTAYEILRGAGEEQRNGDTATLLDAGDVNGDGTSDLNIVYPNGDTQLMYVLL